MDYTSHATFKSTQDDFYIVWTWMDTNSCLEARKSIYKTHCMDSGDGEKKHADDGLKHAEIK